jgi:vitamin B12 transporter
MMITKILKAVCFVAGISISFLNAQNDSSSILLDEVVVVDVIPEKYVAGSKIQRIDSLKLVQNNGGFITDLFYQYTPVYIKEYGNGTLATVAFRGTGANHTAVLWNGININSLTLGHSDLGLTNAFAIDEVALQYGSASSLYGSDAIGGTVFFNSKQPLWKKQFSVGLQQDVGSFGRLFSGIKTIYGNKKWTAKTKIYQYSLENNFKFIYRGEEKTQNNATVQNYGLVQEFNYQFNSRRWLSLKGWYSHNYREIQPLVSNNDFYDEDLMDNNTRIVADYYDDSKVGFFNVKLGYVRNYQLYNDQSVTATSQYISALEYEKDFHEQVSLKIGGNWYHIITDVESYQKTIHENRNDVYASLRWQAKDFWVLNLNARQGFVSGFQTPFTPSLGSELKVLNQNNHVLKIKTLASRSYKVPTLNDRFWGDVGNPNLKPENGWNVEGGLDYNLHKEKWDFNTSLTAYKLWVDDWIIWQPNGSNGLWVPDNVRKVEAQGLEYTVNLSYQKNDWKMGVGGNYAYTKSHKKTNEDGKVDKQLPYTPLHKANLYANVGFKTWGWTGNMEYTGLRYETFDNIVGLNTSVPAYTLMHTSLSKNFLLKKHFISVLFQVKNLLNKEYQNYIKRAMPSRNFVLSVRYGF